MIRQCVILTGMLALATQAMAHDGKRHATLAEADNHIQSEDAPNLKGIPLPFNLGGPFSLIDQNGNTRTEVDPNGHLQLLFFGYATCREICSVALPQMAEVEQGLAERGVTLTPVLITVDPVRDTVATMGPALRKYSPAFIGLTGDKASLKVAYRAFSIDSSLVFEDPIYGAVYAHGSFLYLLDAQGGFLTVIPPILTTDRVIDLIAGYAPQG